MPDLMMDAADALSVHGLSKRFPGRRGGRRAMVAAVDDVSLHVRHGQTLGLVGESGCGKSTLARLILDLIHPDAGDVHVGGEPFTTAAAGHRRTMRRRLQIVFQDALSSLNPRMTAGVNIAEPMRLQGLGNGAERRAAARDLLALVGLAPQDADRYPHEFSGGQCQRIAIARALILRPRVVVFDEAVSALDVSIRAQILRLIMDLQQRLGLSYLFISHDLGVVRRVSDEIAVMYLGRIVETGPADAVVHHPLHPYSEALLRAIPIADPRRMRVRDLGITSGEAAADDAPAAGCAFQPRCPHRMPVCATKTPPLLATGLGRSAACHLHH